VPRANLVLSLKYNQHPYVTSEKNNVGTYW
jgi:hypothetical protein